MASNMNSFPMEILTIICTSRSISRSDLRNLRLVSKAWNSAAQPVLFGTVFLKINLLSFARASKISQHEIFRKYVRILIYNVVLLPQSFGISFKSWLKRCAGYGFHGGRAERKKLLAERSKRQLKKHFNNYNKSIRGQDHILNNEQSILLEIFRQLPGLSTLEHTCEVSSNVMTLGQKGPLFNSIKCPTARLILAAPDGLGESRYGRQFLNLLQVASLAPEVVLKRIRGSQLEQWHEFMLAPNLLGGKDIVLPTLQSLTLDFHRCSFGDTHTMQLAKVLIQASSLTNLKVSFGRSPTCELDRTHGILSIPKVIENPTHWHSLQNLSLNALATSAIFLRDLLQEISLSLRTLVLVDIDFRRSATSSPHGHDTWINFFHFLADTLSLKRVRFGGVLFYSGIGVWTTNNRLEGWPQNCLKYQIERFITDCGPCPFTLITDYGNLNDSHSQWEMRDDDSFPRSLEA